MPQSTIDEIHEIMFILRGKEALNDGDYRSKHLGSILSYLRETKREDITLTKAKLAVKIGMAGRQIKENFLDGLIAFDIIRMATDCKEWYWIGVTGIREKYGQLPKRHDNNGDNKE